MSFVDKTQQYRHGVLIGNWNEDQYGIERAQDPASSGMGLSTREHYLSISKASYLRPDQKALAASKSDKYSAVDCRIGVGADLISQDSANPRGEFVTTYGCWGQGQENTLKPDYTLSKVTVRYADVLLLRIYVYYSTGVPVFTC